MLPKHGFWPLNYIPLVLLVGVEPTTKQILSLSPLPIGLQEQILVLLVGIVDAKRLPAGYPQHTVFETAASSSSATRASLAAPPGLEPGIFAFKGRYVANYTTGLYCQGRV